MNKSDIIQCLEPFTDSIELRVSDQYENRPIIDWKYEIDFNGIGYISLKLGSYFDAPKYSR